MIIIIWLGNTSSVFIVIIYMNMTPDVHTGLIVIFWKLGIIIQITGCKCLYLLIRFHRSMNSKTTITFSSTAIAAVAILFALGPIVGNQPIKYCHIWSGNSASNRFRSATISCDYVPCPYDNWN